MKVKHLLLFLFALGCSVLARAQSTEPYPHLLITELRGTQPLTYLEITNKGDKTIDLAEIEYGRISPWITPRWIPEITVFAGPNWSFFPHHMLAPGESFVIAYGYDYNPKMWKTDPLHWIEKITQDQMWTIADAIIHGKEATSPTPLDSVTPFFGALIIEGGYNGVYLRHHFINSEGERDSMLIDQINVVTDPEDGLPSHGPISVAGVADGALSHFILRRNSITTGITEFSSHEANYDAADIMFENNKGTGLDDSEWMPIPYLGTSNSWTDIYRDVIWTVGNSVDVTLDANTLEPKPGKTVQVDLAASKITVPWGIRYNDSIMRQFVKKPGLAWHYHFAPTSEDSAYTSIRTGDSLTLYMAGNQLTWKKFGLVTLPPTASDNKVVSKSSINYSANWTADTIPGSTVYTVSYSRDPYYDYITDGVAGMDSINRIGYGTRVDTLMKYLEKPPKATWKIIYKSGVEKPDIAQGDILRVTSENGINKDYFLNVAKYLPEADADLTSITWPDMPEWFKGDLAGAYGWKGDTIPNFNAKSLQYQVKIPVEYDGIPALTYTKSDVNSRVLVTRATTLSGTPADRTVTFTVHAENDTTIANYTVEFIKERDLENVQPWIGDPFFVTFFHADAWSYNTIEAVNPGTEPLDFSNYMFVADPQFDMSVTNIFARAKDYITNFPDDAFLYRYNQYIPGRKWANKPDWDAGAQFVPQADLAHNSIVQPGETFAASSALNWMYTVPDDPYGDALPYWKSLDMDFTHTGWVDELGAAEVVRGRWGCFTSPWCNHDVYLLKILNDSVKNGTKWALDIEDFEVIDVLGPIDQNDLTFVGVTSDGIVDPAASYTIDQIHMIFRKPHIYKGNPVKGASMGADYVSGEWDFRNEYTLARAGDNDARAHVWQKIGTHIMDEVTVNQSTVKSKWYKVSPGYSQNETIQGVKTGTTVNEFLMNLVKKNPLQTLTVTSGAVVLPPASAVITGTVLTVLSADSTNTTKYVLDVTEAGLSANALLTSAMYTITASDATGTVGGFAAGTLLKDVVDGVVVPAGATLTVTDVNDAYMSLQKLNYDTMYVNVLASTNVYFKVVAENFSNEITYQLVPDSDPSDAYVSSDVYSVDQDAALIQFVPYGTTVAALSANVYPASGASFIVVDKMGYERGMGGIYQDDKLVVTAADGVTKKVYYFSMLNYKENTYLAYVTSDTYKVDQLALTIKMPAETAGLAEFYMNLVPSYGASLTVTDASGNPVGTDVLVGHKLVVTAMDNSTVATYDIQTSVGVRASDKADLIRMYPNPTHDRVVINGLSKGNRVRVFNATGVTLRDVRVTNSTEYVSLATHPAGIYVFVISDGEKFLSIQKIVKK